MAGGAPRVLVVDDDVDTCENLRDILSDCGYAVSVAHCGEEALALVGREPFDVALLDLKMPGMDGLMLFREIRKLRADTVGVIVSAYATGETAAQALQAGAWRVLNKPVDFDQLMPLLESAARQPLVMIVDDDRELCTNLWEILQERGYRVETANNEAQAAARLAERDHGVVLIDMKLPQGDGRSVFRLVRERNPEARVILITGHRSDLQETIQRILAEGAQAVCYKPFDMSELLKTIDRLAASSAT